MKILLSIAFSLALAPVFCTQYLGINVGGSHAAMTSETHNPKMGYKCGANYGFVFQNGFRAEVEFSYQKNRFKTKYNTVTEDIVISKEYRSIDSMVYMANVLYDIVQIRYHDITPYIGVGAGYSQNTEKNKIKYDLTTNQDKFKDDRFVYQGIVGFKYNHDELYTTALEYHYVGGKPHRKSHDVSLSLVRHF